jgi:hypothetical protein
MLEISTIINTLCEAMPDAIRVRVVYQGGGDEGEICSSDVFYPDDVIKDLEGVVGHELCNKVEYAVHGIINNQRPGWENNEGGFGEVTFNLKSKRAFIKHTDYIQSTKEHPKTELKQ